MKDENATFRDFQNSGCRDLRVYATDLNIRNVKEFSHQQTPDVVVAEAVCASMSIPLFFKAFKIESLRGKPDEDHFFVDGGVVADYPIWAFDPKNKNGKMIESPGTLGMFLHQKEPQTSYRLKTWHIGQYLKALSESSMAAQYIDVLNSPRILNRTMLIDPCEIPATDFDLNDEDKRKLYCSGYKSMRNHLGLPQKSCPLKNP